MPDLETSAQLIGFLILILLNVGRRMGKEESPAGAAHGDQQDERLRLIESRMSAFEVAGLNREKRLDDIHRKMSDLGDKEQAFVGAAMERFVSRRECDARHGRE